MTLVVFDQDVRKILQDEREDRCYNWQNVSPYSGSLLANFRGVYCSSLPPLSRRAVRRAAQAPCPDALSRRDVEAHCIFMPCWQCCHRPILVAF
jgi:hypothetical protein